MSDCRNRQENEPASREIALARCPDCGAVCSSLDANCWVCRRTLTKADWLLDTTPSKLPHFAADSRQLISKSIFVLTLLALGVIAIATLRDGPVVTLGILWIVIISDWIAYYSLKYLASRSREGSFFGALMSIMKIIFVVGLLGLSIFIACVAVCTMMKGPLRWN